MKNYFKKIIKDIIHNINKKPIKINNTPDILQTVHAQSNLKELSFAEFCLELEKHIAKKPSLIQFNEAFYLSANPDIAEEVKKGNIVCGYIHYCIIGQYEHRATNADELIGLKHPDWKKLHAVSDLKELSFSIFCTELEKHIAKQPSLIEFDEEFYLSINLDVAEEIAKGNISCGYVHYYLEGQYEGRFHDEAAFMSLKYHEWKEIHLQSNLKELPFLTFCKELEKHIDKKSSLIEFDEEFYLSVNLDVAEEIAKGNISCGYVHYYLEGQYEGRICELSQCEDKSIQHAISLDILRVRLEEGVILNPTIIFDHNGGGGSNAYTEQLIKCIYVNTGTVLRVYYFYGFWFVQWRSSQEKDLFKAESIEQVFEILSLVKTKDIILNSIYGYPNIAEAIIYIIDLVNTLDASLDIKIHDFYALCPSPHLSDFENKYCKLPKDFSICTSCLENNLGWYHRWYPRENRATDIIKWREPFAKLFASATILTFFDESSVDLIREVFALDNNKVRVIPHEISHFSCDLSIDITGALHIGILGALSHIKGGDVVNSLAEYINEQQLAIPITAIGSSFTKLNPTITVHGHYVQQDLPLLIRDYGVNVIFMSSIIPETFSYTISEAIEMGLPIVAFDIGAQGRRVRNYKLGKVIPLEASPSVILTAIQSVLKAAQEQL